MRAQQAMKLVSRLGSTKKSRRELLSTSEALRATTRSVGMWRVLHPPDPCYKPDGSRNFPSSIASTIVLSLPCSAFRQMVGRGGYAPCNSGLCQSPRSLSPGGQASIRRPPEGRPPEGRPPEGRPPGSQPPGGQPPGGQPPAGRLPAGQAPGGQPPGSQPRVHRAPGGQPPGGQPPGRQPPGSQPPSGRAPGGQPPGGSLPGGRPPGG